MALPHSLMLALSPTFACRRAPSRLIRDRHYTAARHISSSAALGSPPSSLAGTAPFHAAYVLLHTHDPPAVYPARSKSPTWRHLTLAARQWGGTVNFAWSPDLRVHPQYKGLGEEGAVALSSIPEIYTASVFSIAHRHGRLEIPEVSGQNYQEVSESIQRLVSSSVAVDEGKLDKRLHLFVCTHGSRDCRCGEGGGEVARALRRALQKRGIGAKDVVLGEVAHVGGHKYAANVLVYPYGEWLGTVQDFDVPMILDEILDWHARYQARVSQSGRPSEEMPPLCPPFWRGRMGLDKEEQLALFQKAA